MAAKNTHLHKVLDTVSNLLSQANIAHILIGGIAIGLRGYPRSTIDIDYLVSGEQVNHARSLLEKNGFICEVETEESLHFTGAGQIDFLIAKRPMSLQMLSNGTKLPDIPSNVALVEDLIGLKIQAYCNDSKRKWKDQADIAELIRANPALDWEQVINYAKIFEQEEVLNEIRQGVS